MARLVCPSCLQGFSRPVYVDARGEVVQLSWLQENAPRLYSLLRRSDGTHAQLAARAHARGLSPRCPHNLAHVLPEDHLTRRTLVIGLVGMRGSGKTTYVTQLIETLLRGSLSPLGVSVTLDGTSNRRHTQENRRTLIVDHVPVPVTPPVTAADQVTDQPWSLRLSRAGGETINLLLYDASGEQLYSARDMGEVNRYLYACDGIIMMFSPGAFPGLEPLDDQALDAGIAQATEMTTSLVDVLRRSRGLRRDAVVQDCAVAVVLGKADKLAHQPGFPDHCLYDVEAFVRENPLATVLERVEAGSEDLIAYLNACGGENLVGIVLNNLPHPTFHAVSATGHDVGGNGRYPDIRQTGVVEPLVTLLAHAGFLPADAVPTPAATPWAGPTAATAVTPRSAPATAVQHPVPGPTVARPTVARPPVAVPPGTRRTDTRSPLVRPPAVPAAGARPAPAPPVRVPPVAVPPDEVPAQAGPPRRDDTEPNVTAPPLPPTAGGPAPAPQPARPEHDAAEVPVAQQPPRPHAVPEDHAPVPGRPRW